MSAGGYCSPPGGSEFPLGSESGSTSRAREVECMDLEQLAAIARREMAKNGLHGWAFGLSRTRRGLGACKYKAKRIEIAEYYARNSPPETVLDTLLHEIAHALAGPAARH